MTAAVTAADMRGYRGHGRSLGMYPDERQGRLGIPCISWGPRGTCFFKKPTALQVAGDMALTAPLDSCSDYSSKSEGQLEKPEPDKDAIIVAWGDGGPLGRLIECPDIFG